MLLLSFFGGEAVFKDDAQSSGPFLSFLLEILKQGRKKILSICRWILLRKGSYNMDNVVHISCGVVIIQHFLGTSDECVALFHVYEFSKAKAESIFVWTLSICTAAVGLGRERKM